MNLILAKKEIYSFLRKKLKIPAKQIDKNHNGNMFRIKFKLDNIIIVFDSCSCRYYLIRHLGVYETNYTELEIIKNNLKKIVKAIRLLEELN